MGFTASFWAKQIQGKNASDTSLKMRSVDEEKENVACKSKSEADVALKDAQKASRSKARNIDFVALNKALCQTSVKKADIKPSENRMTKSRIKDSSGKKTQTKSNTDKPKISEE